MDSYLGSVQMGALRALKKYFDPEQIMNPGGPMGLDLPEEAAKQKEWRIDWKSIRGKELL
jgi:alkyldihydroxyacetonephosphate synthase